MTSRPSRIGPEIRIKQDLSIGATTSLADAAGLAGKGMPDIPVSYIFMDWPIANCNFWTHKRMKWIVGIVGALGISYATGVNYTRPLVAS